jgi:peroxiredoxin
MHPDVDVTGRETTISTCSARDPRAFPFRVIACGALVLSVLAGLVVAFARPWEVGPRAARGETSAPSPGPEASENSPELVARLTRVGFSPGSGRRAPALSYRGIDGTIHSLEQLRGMVVVIAFWGTTCIPCMDELADLGQLADRFRESELVVLPVCLDETDAKAATDVARPHAPDLPVYVDLDGAARRDYEVRALPQAALVDRDGRLLARTFGGRPWRRDEVDELLCTVLGVPFPLKGDRPVARASRPTPPGDSS